MEARTSSCDGNTNYRPLLNAGRMPFFASGFLLAAWAPLIPYVKERANIESESTLGLLLLCLGAGSLFAMSIAGTVTSKWGCRSIIAPATLLAAITLIFLSTVTTILGVACSLFMFGLLFGFLEVAMNVHAVLVQNTVGRPVMSGFHSLYSVGGFAGAGGVSLLLSVGLTPLWAVIPVILIVAILVSICGRKLINEKSRESMPFFVLPRGIVLVIGILCFITFLIEGSILDWGAIFLSTFHHVEISSAGLGYSAFAIAMTFARMMGDRLVALNKTAVIVLGSVMETVGFSMVAFTSNPVLGFFGFILIGLGAANIVPILFVEATKQSAMPVQLSLAAVSLIAYTGGLAGPALIGFVSSGIGLPATFGLLGVIALSPAILAKRILTT